SRPGSCAAGSVRPRHLPPHPPAAKVRVSIYGRGVTSQKTDTSAVDDEPEAKLNRQTVYVIFGALVGAMFISSLDQSVVSTALPTIVGDLGAVAHEGWIVTAYLLTIAVAMPVYGKVGDLYGRRWAF